MTPRTTRRAEARRVVDELINDLTDRSGLRQEWDRIDKGTQDEIRQAWTEIILQRERIVKAGNK